MQAITLNSADLLSYFDLPTLDKGLRYAAEDRVISFAIDRDRLFGKVVGRRPYAATLVLDLANSEVVDTDCSCPLGMDCKHAAALLLRFLKHLEAGKRRGATPSLAVPELRAEQPTGVSNVTILSSKSSERQPDKFSEDDAFPICDDASTEQQLKRLLPAPEVKHSLQRIAHMRSAPPHDEQFIGARNSITSYQPKSRLVYLLIDGTRKPILELGTASLRKDNVLANYSDFPLGKLVRTPPNYATTVDCEIGLMWHKLVSSWQYNDLSSVIPEGMTTLLKKILSTGRCFLNDLKSPALRLGEPLIGKLKWFQTRGGYSLHLVAVDGEREYGSLTWSRPWYVDRQSGVCGPILCEFPEALWGAIQEMRALTADELRGLPLLLAQLELTDLIPEPPDKDALRINQLSPVPVLNIKTARSKDSPGARVPVGVLSFQRQKDRIVNENGILTLHTYDQKAESQYKRRLEDLGLEQYAGKLPGESEPGSSCFTSTKPEDWLAFGSVHIPQLREEGWLIPEASQALLKPIEIEDEDLTFEVEGEDSWWFSLALHIKIDGKEVPLLPLLTAAVRQLPPEKKIVDSLEHLNDNGRFTAVLADGRFISLPFERIRSVLISLGELLQKNDNPKLSPMDLQQLFDETLLHNRWVGAERVQELLQRLKRLSERPHISEPKFLKADLRSYQSEGVAWLQQLARERFGGLLADDMGLGKTMQLLAHICLEKEHGRLQTPFLVICPTSVLPNWVAETEKFSPSLKVLAFYGADRWGRLDAFNKYDLVLTTYSLVSRDVDRLKQINWHGIALDEAQAIKNAKSDVARSVRSLKAEHRLCLTGTPVENNLGELWSHFQFVLPGLLGDQATFNTCIRNPIEKGNDLTRKSLLAARIRPFLLRRTKQEVATELPEKITTVQYVELEGAQRDLYETVRLASTKQVRDEIAKKGFKQSQIMILDALLKLRQVCCDPRLVKLSVARKVPESAKLDLLMDMLAQLIEDGRKILVFSQFTSMLDLIAERLKASDINFVELRGDTRNRSIPIKQFQYGKYPVFLLSLKSGGVGLNLTAADVVIHYDPWWNPAAEDQATDRAHRIGQDKKVFAYKLIAKGTIEERMLALQNRKRALAAGIYAEDGGLSAALTEQDIMALLSPINEHG